MRHPSKGLIHTVRGKGLPKTPVGKGLLGCLGCLGVIFVLLVGSAIIAGMIQAFSDSDSIEQTELSSDSMASPETTTPASVSIPESDGQINGAGNEESAPPLGERPGHTENGASPVSDDTKMAPAAQLSLDKLNQLEVKGRAPETGYARDLFGKAGLIPTRMVVTPEMTCCAAT